MKKFLAVLLLSISFFAAKSQGVVVSQVYGGGGNAGSVYTNDFVELFNAGATPVSLNGWSVQYNSATGSGTWQVTNLSNFTLQPGQYYLVAEAAGAGGTTPLPTPDVVGAINMSGTAGKIALVNNTTALSGCPTAANYVDLVGFGATATCFEGTGPTPAPSNSNSVIRGNNGCLDANQNATDFTSVTAAPRNSAITTTPCGGALPALVAAPTTLSFPNTTALANSASQSFSLSGSALTGAPGVITITAPSTEFQVSNNNTSWGPTTTVAYSSATLSATNVYVRFTPQSTGLKSGNVTITGGGVSSAVNVAVSGTGTTPQPTLTVTGTIADFGNIVILNNSASQSFNLSGTNLTGAPGVITITAPSTDFQVSNNNTLFAPTTTIAYTSATLASTPVYVRFTPQTVGAKSGNVSITGGGVSTAVTVAVSGTGVGAPVPSLSASALAGLGSLCLNVTGGPNSFTITGSNLTTANVTVAALTGYTYSTTSGGTYTTTLSLTQPGGSYSQQVFVKLTPTAVASYNGNIALGGGGTASATNVPATGAGVNTTPSLTTGISSGVTSVAATLAGSITANGCTAPTAYGIEYSTVNGFVNGSGTQVPSTNIAAGNYTSAVSGLLPSTTYYYKAYATNAGGTGYGTQLSFTTATPVLGGTALAAFGGVCLNATGGPNSFTVTGNNLTNANVNVGPLAGYTFSTTSGGTYTATLSIAQSGGGFSQQVFVKFTPVAVTSYSGNIPVGGGAAALINVPVTGSGVNTGATVTTGTATVLSANGASLGGAVTSIGCSAVTSYGIEYSGINGFADGAGTKVAGSNINGSGVFTTTANGLVQNSVYYYKAYAINNGGISYGPQQTFTTKKIPAGLVIYSNPIARGGSLHFTLDSITSGHYAAQIFDMDGRLVFQKDMIVQLNFIDETFAIPAKLGIGRYVLQVGTIKSRVKKSFMIQ